MTCRRFVEYSESEVADSFTAHLEECADCAAKVAKTKLLEKEVAAMAREADNRIPSWSVETRQRLIEASISPSVGKRARLWAPAAIAAAALVAVFVVSSSPEEPARPAQIDALSIVATAIHEDGKTNPIQMDRLISAPSDARLLLRVGHDVFGLEASGRVRVEAALKNEVRLRLEKGVVACQVAHRNKEGQFTVVYRSYSIRVVGTRFSVGADKENQLLVSVIDGEVKVTGPDQLAASVKAGQTLKIAKENQLHRETVAPDARNQINVLLSPEATRVDTGQTVLRTTPATAPELDVVDFAPRTSPPSRQGSKGAQASEDLTDWQEMVIDGQYQRAESALRAHLRRFPRDANAWWLLATCRRKAGDWPGAVDAYDSVIRNAGASRKDKARFRAATILQEKQGNHDKALEYLGAYLKNAGRTKPLRAEALIRQATSYLSMGQKKQAVSALKTVISDYGNTPAATRAKHMLQQNQ
jgi:tetratricopeptide (TPR) repeat protein